jgi:hypothetical protein
LYCPEHQYNRGCARETDCGKYGIRVDKDSNVDAEKALKFRVETEARVRGSVADFAKSAEGNSEGNSVGGNHEMPQIIVF